MTGTEPIDVDPGGEPVPWRAFVREAESRLAAAGLASPDVDARRIVEQASGYEGADYHAGLDELATERGVAAFDAMMMRRLRGEPLQYVVGRWGFRHLDLMVDRRVLIPRPETEVVAGVALDELDRQAGVSPLIAIDLGTGSGAIGLAIAGERTDARVVVSDVSEDAVAVARANLAGLGRSATRVSVVCGSWFEPLSDELRGECALVVSNPPYVATGDELPPEVADWEPTGALVAGVRGTEALEHLIDGAGHWLRPQGALVLEMAPHQTAAMAERATRRGYVDVAVVTDLASRERAVRARWPG